MVPSFGPGMTLVLLLLTPLFWSLPVALAMSELAAAMPDEGGYVTWTRRAFGPFWAFQVGWWSWVDSFVDVAVYPALFVEYVRFWYPAMTPLERWLLVVVFVAVLTALNVIGVRPTGRAAVVLAVAALLPVAAFTFVGLRTARQSPWTPLVPEGQGLEALGLGLAVVMWNYSGWDTPTTVLGETRAPERTFRLAAFLALPVLTASYVAPVVVSAALYAIFAAFSFKELIVLNVWLYSISLLVELAAFVSLRAQEPDLARPWRVPGGFGGAMAVVVCPALFSLAALATAGWLNTLAGVVAALTGPAAYAMLRRPTPDSPR